LWITILRFCCDYPEPRYHTMVRDTSSVMSKVTATLGRNFIRSKEFQEVQQMNNQTNGHENVIPALFDKKYDMMKNFIALGEARKPYLAVNSPQANLPYLEKEKQIGRRCAAPTAAR
jgi:hypothetical protein